MHVRLTLASLLVLLGTSLLPAQDGFVEIFDGKTLDGWDGDPKFWSVEDGAITGRTTKENPTKGNTFIVWDGEVGDFELVLDYKIVGGNSGIQYRSFRLKNAADKWRIGGYQADIDSKDTYSGIVYGERARGILVGRGQKGVIGEDGKKKAERFAESAAIQAKIKKEDWNTYRIVAEGNHFVQYINGVKTSELTDNDAEGVGKRMAKGLLALQLHAGPPMVVQFKNVKLKKLDGEKAAALPAARPVPGVAPNPALVVRMDAQGRATVDGRLFRNLAFALAPVANDVLANGVVLEIDRNCPHSHAVEAVNACRKRGVENIRMTLLNSGLTVESEQGRIDVSRDGAISARTRRVGFDYADGRGRISLLGIPVFRFGGEEPTDAVEVPEVDLGAPAELDLGAEGSLEESSIETESSTTFVAADAPRKIVFVAGRQSHGYGAHEHKAGCMLLADQLEKSGLPVETKVVTNGWPEDTSVFDGANCIVVYADGGGRHPFHAHVDEVDALAKKGVGIVCIHYGVEVPKGKSGDAFLEWTGGFFETNWSVNPHWEAEFDDLPDHPTTSGVKPFKVNDEWYYHMRFREEGVTPILTDLPPKSTLVKPDGSLARPDNAHNNNPHVRKAILERMEPQHVAWAREREDGGRGFGITGGHFHWNWGNDQMRKLMLNAIVWSAGMDVPAEGVPTQPVSVENLMANQDYDVPKSFNPVRYEMLLKQWNGAN